MRGTRLEKHHFWKGEQAGYNAKHERVRRRFGRPKECAWCLKSNKTEGQSIIYYANISGSYLFDRNDWVFLCASCHKRFDWNDETSKKISASKKGKKAVMPPSWLEAVRYANLAKRKKVISVSPAGEQTIYSSIIEASRITGVLKGNIVRACKEPHRMSGGLKWRYYKPTY